MFIKYNALVMSVMLTTSSLALVAGESAEFTRLKKQVARLKAKDAHLRAQSKALDDEYARQQKELGELQAVIIAQSAKIDSVYESEVMSKAEMFMRLVDEQHELFTEFQGSSEGGDKFEVYKSLNELDKHQTKMYAHVTRWFQVLRHLQEARSAIVAEKIYSFSTKELLLHKLRKCSMIASQGILHAAQVALSNATFIAS